MLIYLIALILISVAMLGVTLWAAWKTWCCESWEDAYLFPSTIPFWLVIAILWIVFLAIQ